jgi:hypothetical protein
MRLLVDNLIEEVRSLTDERNNSGLDDDLDILPALNRAQDRAANILARQYESPLLAYVTLDLQANVSEYAIPEDALEDRVEKIECLVNGYYYPVDRISFRDISQYESAGKVQVPSYYCIVGNKIRLVPTPSGAYDCRMWYLVDPPPLKKASGQIISTNEVSNYVVVDTLDSNLSTTVTAEGNYVSIVDGLTGKPKGFFQIQSISGTRITFRTVPTKTQIQGKTLSSSMTGLEIGVDDFLVIAPASCIPFLRKPLSSYIVQFAVAELVKKMGGPADMEWNILKMLEKEVESSWVGREQTLRVSPKSSKWGRNARNALRIITTSP